MGAKPGNWVAEIYRLWPLHKVFNRILAILLLFFPGLLWLLPVDFFDDKGGQPLCPSRLILDMECPGCGLTRAVMHMHHFDPAGALYYNAGIVVVYPLLLGLWAWLLYRACRWAR